MNIKMVFAFLLLASAAKANTISLISPAKKVALIQSEETDDDDHRAAAYPQVWILRPWKKRCIVRLNLAQLSGAEAFSQNGRFVAFGCLDGTLRVFEARTGNLRARFGNAWGHQYNFPYKVQGVAFSPDGRTLASANPKGIFLWNWRTGKLLFSRPLGEQVIDDPNGFAFHRWPFTIKFSPNGRTVAVGGKTANDDYVHVFLFDVRHGGARHLWHIGSGDGGPIELAFSPGGNRLMAASAYFASASSYDQARLFDTRSGRILWQEDNSALIAGGLDDTGRWPNTAAFSADGRRVAISGSSFGYSFLEIRRASDGKRLSLRTDTSDFPSLELQKQLRAELNVR